MNKYLDLTSWILLFFFAPFTVLILLSQNTLPGDFLYPVKTGLENIILAAASVSPSTKVAFRTGLTQTRFSEAQQLLALKGNTVGFSGFVDEVSMASQDLVSLSNPETKTQSTQALIAKIDQYQQQLNQVQNQVQIAQNLAQPNQPVQTPTPLSTSSPVPTPTPTPIKTAVPVPTTQPSQTPTQPSETPVQSPATVLTPVPTVAALAPSVTNAIANNPIKAAEVTQTIKETEQKLQRIKDEIKQREEGPQTQQEVHQNQGESEKRQENGTNH